MIKLKSIIVIILSSILISSAILLTIFGLSLYLGWKETESCRLHRNRLALLNAKLYSQFVDIRDLQAKYEKDGIYKGRCLIEGTIRNNGYRTISSVKLNVEFLNASGNAIHNENFLPLKSSVLPRTTTIAALSLFTSGKELPLFPGESIRFKHVLSEQKDKDIVSPIKHKKYATNPDEWSGKFNYKIASVKF